MNIILLQHKLLHSQIQTLMEEFPQFLFLTLSPKACHTLDEEHWRKVEVLFGSSMLTDDFARAHQLKWIHCTSANCEQLASQLQKYKEGVILSATDPIDQTDQAHMFLAAILSFAKRLPNWKDVANHPHIHWETKWQNCIWKMEGKILLLVGFSGFCKILARLAMELGMRVFCVEKRKTFQPHCNKILALQEYHAVLPAADVVVFNYPHTKESKQLFGKKEISLLKNDAILAINGCVHLVDQQTLIGVAEKKLRGVLIEQNPNYPLTVDSPLWKLKNVLITPDISHSNTNASEELFRDFHFNLRQYIRGNYLEMKNRISF